jgi:hypothetical protein
MALAQVNATQRLLEPSAQVRILLARLEGCLFSRHGITHTRGVVTTRECREIRTSDVCHHRLRQFLGILGLPEEFGKNISKTTDKLREIAIGRSQ